MGGHAILLGVFGWQDTPLPEFLNNTVRYGCSLGLLLLLFSALRSNAFFGGAGFFLATMVSLLAFLACIAVGYYVVHYGVTGRYLIGPYVLLLMPAYEGYRRILDFPGRPVWGHLPAGAGVCVVGVLIHCTAWLSILNRYF